MTVIYGRYPYVTLFRPMLPPPPAKRSHDASHVIIRRAPPLPVTHRAVITVNTAAARAKESHDGRIASKRSCLGCLHTTGSHCQTAAAAREKNRTPRAAPVPPRAPPPWTPPRARARPRPRSTTSAFFPVRAHRAIAPVRFRTRAARVVATTVAHRLFETLERRLRAPPRAATRDRVSPRPSRRRRGCHPNR